MRIGAIAPVGSALILNAADRIFRSQTFTSSEQSQITVKSDKSSSPQNAANSMLQACAPQK